MQEFDGDPTSRKPRDVGAPGVVARLKPCPDTSGEFSAACVKHTFRISLALRLCHERGPGLQPLLPVSRFSFVMSHGQDAQGVGIVQVDDGEREAMKHEPPSSAQVLGSSLRGFHNLADDTGYRYAKFGGYERAPGAVPSDRVPEIFARLRVKPERLTSHQGMLWRACGALARPVSF